MLQVNFIRNNKEEVIKRLAIKNFSDTTIINKIIELDETRKKCQFEFDETQSKINAASKEIGKLIGSGKKDEAEKKKAEVNSLKSLLPPITDKLNNAESELHETLVKLPNLPHSSVPAGKSAEDNEVVREGGTKPLLVKNKLPHWDLAKKYDLINFEIGNKVTGSGFPFYKTKGAKLQRALIQYFLDYNTNAGYTEYEAPFMVNRSEEHTSELQSPV